ncbi:GNAT family acetyltransferase [Gammaproteobacteria bacterium 45_16_T64]|nr:GNAT family acetyltransferase [Gammaproteobacteria bacterium 45_16_T64]
MSLELQVAQVDDIPEVLALHYRYQIDSISEQDKADGFITTAFTETHMRDLIINESGLFVAKRDNTIVAYVMAASWQYWSQWPMFAHMIEGLPLLEYAGHRLSVENSYQYGPVCVDKSVRGEGVFEHIFKFSLQKMSTRYPVLVTFINKVNPRSYEAHVRKANLEVIQEFEFNSNQYYELACLTSPDKA